MLSPLADLLSTGFQIPFDNQQDFYHNATCTRNGESQQIEGTIYRPEWRSGRGDAVPNGIITTDGKFENKNGGKNGNEVFGTFDDDDDNDINIMENCEQNECEISTGNEDKNERRESEKGMKEKFPQFEENPTKPKKVCRVCGDSALGYNFSVVTCESCKAFFRRNAKKQKELRCPFDNKCEINVKSRRYCPKCRLRKCFEVGMKTEYIMNERQRAEKRRKILEKQTTKNGSDDGGTVNETTSKSDETGNGGNLGSAEITSSPNSNSISPVLQNEQWFDQVTSHHPSTGGNVCAPGQYPMDSSAVSSISPTSTQSPFINNEPDLFGNGEGFVDMPLPKSAILDFLRDNTDRPITAVAEMASSNYGYNPSIDWNQDNHMGFENGSTMDENEQVNPVATWSMPSDSNALCTVAPSSVSIGQNGHWDGDCGGQYSSPFNPSTYLDLKYAKLGELLFANEEWVRWGNHPSLFHRPYDLEEKCKRVHMSLTCVTRQHKRLSSFKSLTPIDQWTLLSAAAHELVVFRLIWKHSCNGNGFRKCHGNHKKPIKPGIRGKSSPEWKEMVASYPDRLRSNDTLLLLLSALVLFDPNRNGVVNREAVQEQQQIYLQLFKDYLESTYEENEAQQAYRFLLGQISHLSQFVNNYALELNYQLSLETLEPAFVRILNFPS